MTQGVFSGCLWLRCRGLLARWEVGRRGCDGCSRGLSTLTCLWSPTCLLLLYWRNLEERHEQFWVRKLLGTYLTPTNCSNCHKCKKCWAGQFGSWGGEGQWTWVKAGGVGRDFVPLPCPPFTPVQDSLLFSFPFHNCSFSSWEISLFFTSSFRCGVIYNVVRDFSHVLQNLCLDGL